VSFTQREARRIIRQAVGRVPEGEAITHLNIMPMMDIMTILLVAFIFSAAVSATALTAGSVQLPRTQSDDDLPEGAATVIISKSGIVVEGESIVAVSNGQVDAAEKEGGIQGVKITRLTNFLAKLKQLQLQALRSKPGHDPSSEKPPELMIIADRSTPYSLLMEVLYSAKQKEAGYKVFRMIVQKSFPTRPAP
jgi:biopolymer transport protein ExbD